MAKKCYHEWVLKFAKCLFWIYLKHMVFPHKEDIERMVLEAEEYKAEDQKQRDKVSSKNSLNPYIQHESNC